MKRPSFLSSSVTAPASVQLPPHGQCDSLFSISTALSAPPYPWDALEPFISADQLKEHFTAHHLPHATALASPLTPAQSIVESLSTHLNWINRRLLNLRTATGHSGGARALAIRLCNIRDHVRLHSGRHVNHTLFWRWMAPPGSSPVSPPGALASALQRAFGSFSEFKACFTRAAMSIEGDGWAWLVVRENQSLLITTTRHEDNPLMRFVVPDEELGIPILGLDMAAHAYSPQYQDNKEGYVNAWWHVLNWTQVAAIYDQFADLAFLLAPPAHDPLWGGNNQPEEASVDTSTINPFKGLYTPIAPSSLTQEEALSQAHLRRAQCLKSSERV
jgi:Fe-Mn family superoxide dismutase